MNHIPNPWQHLRQLTPARIALGRAGTSLPTVAQLDFQFAHAQARDAVHLPLDCAALTAELDKHGLACLPLHSAASDRQTYLQRPDLGRRLDETSAATLDAEAGDGCDGAGDRRWPLGPGRAASCGTHGTEDRRTMPGRRLVPRSRRVGGTGPRGGGRRLVSASRRAWW